MFGAVNALFSGLAFAGVVFALLVQRVELQLQREELRLAREEQARLVRAQQESVQALNRQFLIQTLGAKVAILQASISEAGAAVHRANELIIANINLGVSGRQTTEDFAPGAGERLAKAQKELALVLRTVEDLITPDERAG
jgi:hypothetical protein